jgi:hypothetical protein
MSIRIAKYVFGISAVLGMLFLLPLYFAENFVATESPPAITHPELYYGLISVAVVWQFVYLLVATDPVRFRPLMVVSGLAKLSLFATFLVLFLAGRVGVKSVATVIPDFLMAVFFFVCFFATKRAASPS